MKAIICLHNEHRIPGNLYVHYAPGIVGCVYLENNEKHTLLTKDLADKLCINTHVIFFRTLEEMAKDVSIFSLEEMKDIFLDDVNDDTEYVALTNREADGGASLAFAPGVLSRIADRMQTDKLLIAFSSCHEAMVHNGNLVTPDRVRYGIDGLKSCVPESIWLTDAVYSWDATTGFWDVVTE